MTTMCQYRSAIGKYERECLNREPSFEPVHYDLLSDWKPDIAVPCAEDGGVYAFFGKDGKLLYVGKASHSNTLGRRFCSYFYAKPDRLGAKPRHRWTKRPRYALITATNPAFEAPSLEEYLIHKLKPTDNIVGLRRK